jgi:hypothetical protein
VVVIVVPGADGEALVPVDISVAALPVSREAAANMTV